MYHDCYKWCIIFYGCSDLLTMHLEGCIATHGDNLGVGHGELACKCSTELVAHCRITARVNPCARLVYRKYRRGPHLCTPGAGCDYGVLANCFRKFKHYSLWFYWNVIRPFD